MPGASSTQRADSERDRFWIWVGNVVYFGVIRYNFDQFWYVLLRKIWQPSSGSGHCCQRGVPPPEGMMAEAVRGRCSCLGWQRCRNQGCQMVSFQPKTYNLGKFWRALDWKMLIYFMVIWKILQTFGIFWDHLYISCSFGTFFPVLVYGINKNLATPALIPRTTHAPRSF
jgi:hypothetical protein